MNVLVYTLINIYRVYALCYMPQDCGYRQTQERPSFCFIVLCPSVSELTLMEWLINTRHSSSARHIWTQSQQKLYMVDTILIQPNFTCKISENQKNIWKSEIKVPAHSHKHQWFQIHATIVRTQYCLYAFTTMMKEK